MASRCERIAVRERYRNRKTTQKSRKKMHQIVALGPHAAHPRVFAAKYREAGYWIDQTILEFLLEAHAARSRTSRRWWHFHAQLDETASPADSPPT